MIDALLPLGLLIVVCKIFEGLFNRFGLNSIVAYTITGTLLGPILEYNRANDRNSDIFRHRYLCLLLFGRPR